MMCFTQNYSGQCDIINRNIILTKQVTDTIHAVIPKKYHKYPLTTILKHVDFLDELNILPYVRLLDIMPHDAYSITIHIRTMTILDISQEQKD